MARHKPTFFERLTGSVSVTNFDDEAPVVSRPSRSNASVIITSDEAEEVEEEGQLTIDMYQNEDEIVVQAFVAGVRLDELDVTVTQEMLTLKGRREAPADRDPDSFYYQELYWGAFSRSVMLPQEVDVDEAQASLKNGLLTIRLRRLDRARTQRLKVRHE